MTCGIFHCCCYCSPEDYNIVEQLNNRKQIHEKLINEWEKLGVTLVDNINDVNVADLRRFALELRQINEELMKAKKNASRSFTCSITAKRASFGGAVISTVATAVLMGVSNTTSCTEGYLNYINMGVAGAAIVTTISTYAFQEWNIRINKKKDRLEAFSEQDENNDRLVEKLFSMLHDYQEIQKSSFISEMNINFNKLSEHGQRIVSGCSNSQSAKTKLVDSINDEVEDLPHPYRKKELWTRAITAISAANRLSRNRSRRDAFGPSSEGKNERNEEALRRFSKHHHNLRHELIDNQYNSFSSEDSSQSSENNSNGNSYTSIYIPLRNGTTGFPEDHDNV